MKQWLALVVGLWGSLGGLRAQPAPWPPAGASLAYPRTLLRPQELAAVRAALAAPARQALYQRLWADVQQPPRTASAGADQQNQAAWAKNAAFVVLLGQQPSGQGLALLAPIRGQALRDSTCYLLAHLNPEVAGVAASLSPAPPAAWASRAQELMDYLVAYDLLRGSGAAPTALAAGAARLQEFAGNLYQQSTTPLGLYSLCSTLRPNPTLLTAAALGLAAIVLSEASSPEARYQPSSWAAACLYNLDGVLHREAQHPAEAGLPGFEEALRCCAPLFRALGHFLPDEQPAYTFGATTRCVRNPYFDPAYQPLYRWLAAELVRNELSNSEEHAAGSSASTAIDENHLTKPADLRAAWLAAVAPADSASPKVRPLAQATAAGESQLPAEVRLMAFPQPAPSFLQVQVAGYGGELDLQLLDALGRPVRQQRAPSPARLAVGALAPGYYYLQAADASGQPLGGRQRVLLGP